MERVVYLLGAGFSAPLGLPVVSNFVTKSRDQYQHDGARFKHFKPVLDEIKAMGIVKSYYDADLFNVEEILSILEMGDYADRKRQRAEFVNYIRDVIAFHTPAIPVPTNREGLYRTFAFGNEGPDNLWPLYGIFAAAMCQVEFAGDRKATTDPSTGAIGYTGGPLVCKFLRSQPVKYSVVSLNYDRVLELPIEYLHKHHDTDEQIGWDVHPCANEDVLSHSLLAKLHGTVTEDGAIDIVPPTWNKGRHQRIASTWQRAHEAISEANHIRIIGYSLPVNDSYVRYLLKSAVMDTPNLKSIHVICKDDDQQTVKGRYDSFVHFGDYRFQNVQVQQYFYQMRDRAVATGDLKGEAWKAVEEAHDFYFAAWR